MPTVTLSCLARVGSASKKLGLDGFRVTARSESRLEEVTSVLGLLLRAAAFQRLVRFRNLPFCCCCCCCRDTSYCFLRIQNDHQSLPDLCEATTYTHLVEKGREGWRRKMMCAKFVQWTKFNGLTVSFESPPIVPQEIDEDKELQDSYHQVNDTYINKQEHTRSHNVVRWTATVPNVCRQTQGS